MIDWLQQVFGYHPKTPLLYTQLLFWAFFTILFSGYLLFHRESRNRSLYLALVSLFLYYKAGGLFFFLLLFSTLVDYLLGWGIYRAEDRFHKKLYLAASVAINLGVLAYFKYTFFLVGLVSSLTGAGLQPYDYLSATANAVAGTEFDVESIFLPIGISFYTFQTISYTADIFRGKAEPVPRIVDFAFYVCFFPQLVAGPIVRAAEFVPQIFKPYRVSVQEFGSALFLILNGLVKKILISDYISINFVDRVFEAPLRYSGFENLMAVYGYAIQIYCDFSGYSDIAIGLALLLGFRLPINFNSPYKALDITDFWRRWHMSLSRWLRDYLYIPLGGNRKGRHRTRLNLMLTMLLGGLWHGAAWKFVIWGGLHGLALGLHKMWREFRGERSSSTPWTRLASGVLTFHFVCLGWIFFRAPGMNEGLTMLSQICTFFRADLIIEVLSSYFKVFLAMGLGYFFHWLPSDWKEQLRDRFVLLPDPLKATVLASALLLLYQVKSSNVQPFIYFQF
ncbi:MAG: MBOAT family O-acyltransferase [Acidobacteriota bacterium]